MSFYPAMIDLNMPRDICMHLTRFKAWERRNSGFLIV